MFSAQSVHALSRCRPLLAASRRALSTTSALPIARSSKRTPSSSETTAAISKRMTSITTAAASNATAAAASAPPPAPKRFSLLFYSYVPDILERRDPYRAAHIQGAKDADARGEMRMAGALADPVDGAVFVFSPETPTEKIEAFAKSDPYVVNGLVTEWKVRPWMVVAE